MKKSDLKLFAKCYVEAQSPAEDDTKVLFDFIDEAESYQVVNFIMTGKPERVEEKDSYKAIKEFQDAGLDSIIEVTKTISVSPELIKMTGEGPIPKSVVKLFWNLSQKVTGKKPFASLKDTELWLNKADAQQVHNMTQNLFSAAVGVSAGLLAIVSGFLLKKIAKRTMSKAARACRGLKGKDKTKCMYKFEVEIVKNQKAALQSLVSGCSKTKNPATCKAKLQAKMTGLDNKIARLQKKGKIQ